MALIEDGQRQKEALIKHASDEILQKNNIANGSLDMAIKQAVAKLKEQITQKLFSRELEDLLESNLNKEKIVSQIIEAMVNALQEGGVDADLRVAIAKGIDKQEVFAALSSGVKQRVNKEDIFIGSFKAGVQVSIEKKNLVLDLTDDSTKELLSEYLFGDLKEKIFNL